MRAHRHMCWQRGIHDRKVIRRPNNGSVDILVNLAGSSDPWDVWSRSAVMGSFQPQLLTTQPNTWEPLFVPCHIWPSLNLTDSQGPLTPWWWLLAAASSPLGSLEGGPPGHHFAARVSQVEPGAVLPTFINMPPLSLDHLWKWWRQQPRSWIHYGNIGTSGAFIKR